LAFDTIEVAHLDHVHSLNAGNEDARAPKTLESEHGSHDALDPPVVLLDDVVEILALTQFDAHARVGIDAQDGGRIGAALGMTVRGPSGERAKFATREKWLS
jgi:hypothetical protein